MEDVSIIIINYNTFNLTCNCIESIYNNSFGFNYEIILVDNASSECVPEKFIELYPKLKLIKSSKNLGFSKGNNLGINQSNGEYILLLNSDTIIQNNAIGLALTRLKNDENIGALSAKLLFPDGRHQSCAQRFESVTLALTELFRLQKFMSKKRREELFLGAFFDHEREVEADWIWGTFFMFPSRILSHFPNNQFDDRFFMYTEDKLWCKQIKSLGYKILYFPDAVVTHYMGASAGKKNEMMIENEQTFLNMYYNKFERFLLKFIKRLL